MAEKQEPVYAWSLIFCVGLDWTPQDVGVKPTRTWAIGKNSQEKKSPPRQAHAYVGDWCALTYEDIERYVKPTRTWAIG